MVIYETICFGIYRKHLIEMLQMSRHMIYFYWGGGCPGICMSRHIIYFVGVGLSLRYQQRLPKCLGKGYGWLINICQKQSYNKPLPIIINLNLLYTIPIVIDIHYDSL